MGEAGGREMSLRNCRSRTRPAEGATERVSNHMPPMDGISSFRCIESCIVNPDRQARGNNKKKRKQEQEQPTHSTSNSHASAIISAAPLQASEDASPLLTNPPIRALCSALYQVSTGLHKVIRDRASRPQRGHSCAQNTVKAAAPGRLAVGDALTPGTSQLTPPPSSRREPAPFHSQHDKRTGLPLSGVAAGVANDAAGLLDAVGARHVRGAELHGDALRPSRCSENAPTTYLYRRVLCCAVRVQQGIMPVHHAAETNSTLAEALPSRAARDGAHSTTGPCRRSTRARSSAYSSSLHRSLAEVLTPPASRPLRTRLLHAKNRRAQAEPRPAGNREARQPSRLSAAPTTELHGAT
ncbi:hypothetical protein PCL_06577 [Purpureocillium lilacinum]|uniref:Uncharacterized protein n=1 Tax=Purpureocillium lilacinum TaxID=33203 RepID=A0A2U3EN37_PURLI|nr:hypothetical protein PCL_06577 [Purpureocillium lilacinum]